MNLLSLYFGLVGFVVCLRCLLLIGLVSVL